MFDGSTWKAVLKRDGAIVLSGLALLAGLAWVYMFYLAGGMGEMTGPQMQAWGAGEFTVLFVMWAVMMVAMMVPSAAPMILTFAMISRRRRQKQRSFVPTTVFLMGYLVTWTGFSLLLAFAQWGLHAAALLSPMMVSTSSVLSGCLLLGAGLFQWTRLKHACLSRCASPMGFLTAAWEEGTWGALRMGVKHGSYCIGCCWLLMLLLFATGVMNLLWVAVIAAFVLVEKVMPGSKWVSRGAGLGLMGWGLWMAVSGFEVG